MNKNQIFKELLSQYLYKKAPFTYGCNNKSILRRVLEYYRRHKTVKRVNNALGITLRKWQIHYIFENQSTPLFIELSRRGGKTTAHILFILLNPLMDGIELESIVTNRFLDGIRYDPRAYAKVLYGEDGVTVARQRFFKKELMEIRDRLNAAGIKTNNITIRR